MTAAGLLERERELVQIDEALERAHEADGRLLLVEGPAGIGKTALFVEACERAGSEVLVLTARCGEVERDYPYGVVRQLLELPLRELPADDLATLFTGAAKLAAPIVAGGSEPAARSGRPSADASYSVLHGLYWLTANLAGSRPLLIAVDDAQWADAPSLRFLVHLARRLEGLRVALLLCIRSGEPDMEGTLLSQIAELGAVTLRPGELSEDGVGRLLRRLLGRVPEEGLVSASHAATRGMPFLVTELGKHLAEDGLAATDEAAGTVEQLGPDAVAAATLRRLASLGPHADALARAAAVLGGDAHVHRCAELAELDDASALAAMDALTEANLLRATRPLEFVHPIVRAAVYAALPAGERSASHARAAQSLAAEGAELDAVAAHLLLAEPTGDEETIRRLRAAATHALGVGAPENAATYLRRAAEEGCERALRAELLHELGSAEAVLRDPAAIGHLHEAHQLTEDPVARARIAGDLALILLFAGGWEDAVVLLESALADARGHDPDLVLALETQWAAAAVYDPRKVADFNKRLPELEAAAAGDQGPSRPLALLLGAVKAHRIDAIETALPLVERGLSGGRFITDEGPDSWALPQGMGALICLDELDRADVVASDVITEARGRGSALGLLSGFAHAAWAHARRGNLGQAEADMRTALELGREHGLLFTLPATLGYCVDALVERPELTDLAALVDQLELDPALLSVAAGAYLHLLRGRLALASGEHAEAAAQLRRVAEMAEGLGHDNPNGSWAWRPWLALALAGDDPEIARELARRELELARRAALPRGIGVALRTLGTVESEPEALDPLREATEVLGRSPARLEHARALVDLGAALRRANQRTASREPLRLGFDLAHRCQATRLIERAEAELAIAGARPRRASVTGPDSLTRSEERIARMAADGLTNREIAQALFVTAKTVENQLGRAYKKLSIHSREELAEAMGKVEG